VQSYQKEKQMANDKLDAFMKKQKDFAQDFEDNQKSVGTEPLLKDLTAAFHKNRNEVKIGERTYVIKKFGIRETITLVPILGNAFAVPISAVFKDLGEDADVSGITEALMLLFSSMDNGQFVDIIELLLSKTTVDGKAVDLDEDFDDMGDVFKVCADVLEQSFSPFIKSLDLSRMTSWIQKISYLK